MNRLRLSHQQSRNKTRQKLPSCRHSCKSTKPSHIRKKWLQIIIAKDDSLSREIIIGTAIGVIGHLWADYERKSESQQAIEEAKRIVGGDES